MRRLTEQHLVDGARAARACRRPRPSSRCLADRDRRRARGASSRTRLAARLTGRRRLADAALLVRDGDESASCRACAVARINDRDAGSASSPGTPQRGCGDDGECRRQRVDLLRARCTPFIATMHAVGATMPRRELRERAQVRERARDDDVERRIGDKVLDARQRRRGRSAARARWRPASGTSTFL